MLPTDSKERKESPVFTGFMAYWPLAIAEVARLSKAGNDKHNPGEPLHWSREKSSDHGDCLARHQLECDTMDDDGFLHAVKVAWRGMAQLEILLEKARACKEYVRDRCMQYEDDLTGKNEWYLDDPDARMDEEQIADLFHRTFFGKDEDAEPAEIGLEKQVDDIGMQGGARLQSGLSRAAFEKAAVDIFNKSFGKDEDAEPPKDKWELFGDHMKAKNDAREVQEAQAHQFAVKANLRNALEEYLEAAE